MKTQKPLFELIGGVYTQVGDVLLPNLTIGQSAYKPIGKFGRMRKQYLKEQHPLIYSELLLSEKLFSHLQEIDRDCESRLELMISHIAKSEGVTEALKAVDQMEWVRRMNSIHIRAEELVVDELVYTK